VCLNMLQSRRDEPVGMHLPESVVSDADGIDPEQESLLADSIGPALPRTHPPCEIPRDLHPRSVTSSPQKSRTLPRIGFSLIRRQQVRSLRSSARSHRDHQGR
jgi:hypothetical protein